ncbi:hypothetical protein [Streptomyces flavidovirens]|uniref:hypothetical protein n=1 Tax=Streptomyces flavidovirens TaxID=67298 RepID=UPI0003FF7323|nr:hypothetical protein [Streptomyces flavidovirens]
MNPNVPVGRMVDASPQLCTYSPGDTDANDCGVPATWHIAWDAQMENGLACDQHMAEAQQRFAYFDRHPISPDCGMPNAHWFFELKRCGYPDDPATQEAAEARRQHA